MHHHFSLISLLTLCALMFLLVHGPAQGGQSDDGLYYYSGGQRISVSLVYDLIAVRPTSADVNIGPEDLTATLRSLESFRSVTGESVLELPGQDILIVQLESLEGEQNFAAYRSTVDEIARFQPVEHVGHVAFLDGGIPIVLTSHVVARFRETASQSGSGQLPLSYYA